MPQIAPWILVSLLVGFLGGWLLEYYLDIKYLEVRARKHGFALPAEITSPIGEAALADDESREATAEFDEHWAAELREIHETH